jgi:hypothetical protein
MMRIARIYVLIVTVALVIAKAHGETSAGEPQRFDFEASMSRAAAPVVEPYTAGPPRRVDFAAQAQRSAAPVVETYAPGPPSRVDFEAVAPRSSP